MMIVGFSLHSHRTKRHIKNYVVKVKSWFEILMTIILQWNSFFSVIAPARLSLSLCPMHKTERVTLAVHTASLILASGMPAAVGKLAPITRANL